jgi:hypothetical protein
MSHSHASPRRALGNKVREKEEAEYAKTKLPDQLMSRLQMSTRRMGKIQRENRKKRESTKTRLPACHGFSYLN